jgi:hypothetical protein
MGTEALWNIYPNYVRRWITRKGGLSRKMIFLQGAELAHLVPTCGASAASRAHRNSERRYLPAETLRYERARASSRRH